MIALPKFIDQVNKVSNDEIPKKSDYLSVSPIIIDGRSDWEIFNSTHAWCNGAGTKDDPYIIENIIINGSLTNYCVNISNSNIYFIFRNCTFFNALMNQFYHAAVFFQNISHGKLQENKIYYNTGSGISLLSCTNVTIISNIIHHNDYMGIYSEYSNYTMIVHNNISTNFFGIYIMMDNNNSIIANSILSNERDGLYLRESNFVNISRNVASYHSVIGIMLDYCNNATVTENEAFHNLNGIYVRGESCYIASNNLRHNSGGGLVPQQSFYSIYYKNLIINNTQGIYVDRTSNTFYFNYLDNIDENVYEDIAGTNKWDNGSIGNYYSDYMGSDLDGDGIGEDPFYLNGRPGYTHGPDNYPIVWQKPMLSVLEPLEEAAFSIMAPKINVSIVQGKIISMWYSINNNETKYFFSMNTTIQQSAWDLLAEGNVNITFHFKDIFGFSNSTYITVIKDITDPSINILKPTVDQVFGEVPPSFNMEISDSNFDTMWYSLDGGLTNITSPTVGTIDPTAWSLKVSGTITIIFYANDTAGNISFEEIIVIKDVETPIISIIEPSFNDIFQVTPAYEINVVDANLDKIWYTLNGGEITFITEFTGIIDQNLWKNLPDGYITIRFYANDTVGNYNYDEVIVVKQTPRIIGYNLIGLISTSTIVIALLIILRFKKIFQ